MAFPPITTCLVCEGVREEILHKFTIVGFFGVTPDVRISLRDFNAPFSICFFFCGTAGYGNFNLELRVTNSYGQVVPGAIGPTHASIEPSRSTSNFIFFFHGVVPGPGRYGISLIANGVVAYSSTIDIDRASTGLFNWR